MQHVRAAMGSLSLATMVWSALANISCSKPMPADRLNMQCVTRLLVPRYPPIAQSALVSLSLTAAVSLANGGAVQSIAMEEVSGPTPDKNVKLFRPDVEVSLKASRFAPECDGKTVRLTFSFRFEQDRPPAVWFVSPNRFEIVDVRPVLVGARRP